MYAEPREMWRGALLFGGGDAAAALLQHQFSWTRLAGVAAAGALVYAAEIPRWFGWIDRRCPAGGAGARWARAALALLYFNPLWIARHLAFLRAAAGRWAELRWDLLAVGWSSFAASLLPALAANYLVQNHVSARWRFTASAVVSALMAVYYAMSEVWFR